MIKERNEAINKDLTDAEKQSVLEQYAIRNLQENLMEKKVAKLL